MNSSGNPFEDYQEQVASNRVNVIKDYLQSLKKTRAVFMYIRELARQMAIHVSVIEKRPYSYSTLLRVKRYRKLLFAYMSHPDEVLM